MSITVFEPYQSRKKFRAAHEKACSRLYPILQGVLQGSVLEYFLYILHTADLPKTHQSSNGSFPDDTVLISTYESQQKAVEDLQRALTMLVNGLWTGNQTSWVTFNLCDAVLIDSSFWDPNTRGWIRKNILVSICTIGWTGNTQIKLNIRCGCWLDLTLHQIYILKGWNISPSLRQFVCRIQLFSVLNNRIDTSYNKLKTNFYS